MSKLTPITREEMFLAKAAGEEVPELTPITRIERFLQNLIDHIKSIGSGGGGGGGGATSWEDLGSTFEEGVVLVETALTVSEEMGMGVLPHVLNISSGMEYTVVYNGTEYKCVCAEYVEDGMTALTIGNNSAIGGDDTGEPFMIMCFPAGLAESMGAPGGIIPLDGSMGFTISISGVMESITPVPKKYMPELKNQKTILLDLDSGECNTPFEKVEGMGVDELRNVLQVYSTDRSVTHTVLNIQKTITEYSGIEGISFKLWVLNNSTTEIRRWLWSVYTFESSSYPLTFAPVTDGEANRKDPLYMVAYGGRQWFCSGYFPLKSEGGKYFKLLVNDDGTLFTEEIETPV